MKCVCRVKCQVRNAAGKILTYRRGAVDDFDKCPTHFEPIAGETETVAPIDFLTAGENELMEAKWKFSDAVEAIKAAYNRNLKKGDKEKIVAQILDIRYRTVSSADLDHTR